jgi:PAS domain-containing protein
MPSLYCRDTRKRPYPAALLVFLLSTCLHAEPVLQSSAISSACSLTPPSTAAPSIDWSGLKVLWLGTSIPQQGIRSKDSYPELFCQMMGCIVVNKALAGSRVRWDEQRKNETCKSGRNAPKGLSATTRELQEKQFAALPDDGQDSYDASCNPAVNPLRTGYEYRINRTWEKNDFDVVVLDHGHNDRPVGSSDSARVFGELTPKTFKVTRIITGKRSEIEVEDSAPFHVFDDIALRTKGIPKMDYWTGEISSIVGRRLIINLDSSNMPGALYATGSIAKLDKSKFYDAYNLIINDIFHMRALRDHKVVQVIVVTPPTEWTGGHNDGSIAKVNQALCELSGKWQLPFINLTDLLRIDRQSLHEYLEDGKHPLTHESRLRIAKALANWAKP